MNYLSCNDLNSKNINDYNDLISSEMMKHIIGLSNKLSKIKIAYISTTNARGGVAEIFNSITPIMRGLNINFDWLLLYQPLTQFKISRIFRDYFQGKPGHLSKSQITSFEKYCKSVANELNSMNYDIIIFSDYQSLASIKFLNRKNEKIIWNFHLDGSWENWHPEFEKYIKKYTDQFDHLLLTDRSFIPKNWKNNYTCILPAIDPLTPKNIMLNDLTTSNIVNSYGISLKKPLITQVSRLNPWKDPIGLLKAYNLSKKEVPDLQLAYVTHNIDYKDLEQKNILAELKNKTKNDSNVFFITENSNNLNAVRAFQQKSDIIIQKSVKEGFGLTITEAMWKNRAVIAGKTKGSSLQIDSNQNGILVDSIAGCSNAIVDLLKKTKKRKKMGENAHKYVKNNLLITRYVNEFLQFLLQF